MVDDALGTWRTGADRWHVGFVDLTGGQGLLGQIEERTAAGAWLDACAREWKTASSDSLEQLTVHLDRHAAEEATRSGTRIRPFVLKLQRPERPAEHPERSAD